MDTYVYYSEEEEIYNSKYHCHFNKKLADWAISRMGVLNRSTLSVDPIKKHTLEEYVTMLKTNSIDIPDESYYDGYYLWHMAMADYPKSLDDDARRSIYIKETIDDPDGEPTFVLECFKAKMQKMGVPIYWERFL